MSDFFTILFGLVAVKRNIQQQGKRKDICALPTDTDCPCSKQMYVLFSYRYRQTHTPSAPISKIGDTRTDQWTKCEIFPMLASHTHTFRPFVRFSSSRRISKQKKFRVVFSSR